jgi:hypothetical protein
MPPAAPVAHARYQDTRPAAKRSGTARGKNMGPSCRFEVSLTEECSLEGVRPGVHLSGQMAARWLPVQPLRG